MKKLMLYLLYITLLSSCAYDYVEEYTFRSDNTASLTYTLNLKKQSAFGWTMLQKMMMGTIKGFVQIMDSSLAQRLDTLKVENFAKTSTDSIRNHIRANSKTLQFPLDTIFSANNIYTKIHQSDSTNKLTQDEQQELAQLVSDMCKGGFLNLQVSDTNFSAKMVLPYVNWKNNERIKTLTAKADLKKTNVSTKKDLLATTWDNQTIIRSNKIDGDEKIKPLDSLDNATLEGYKNSTYTVRYNLPSKVKSCSNKHYQQLDNGTTLEFKASVFDIYYNNILPGTEITY